MRDYEWHVRCVMMQGLTSRRRRQGQVVIDELAPAHYQDGQLVVRTVHVAMDNRSDESRRWQIAAVHH